MALLTEQIAELTALIENGQTITAMEKFYADEVTMQENEMPLRSGKDVCLNHERRMLSGTAAFQAKLLNQAINESTGVVFSEWQYESVDLSGQKFPLTEVSVQHWRNELIYSEKFYYNKLLLIP